MTEAIKPVIVKTADGSNTLFSPVFGEHYHSNHGAVQESRHVFIKSGLEHFLDINPGATAVSILEVGFGTGLNFLLTTGYLSSKHVNLDYTGIEAFPVSKDMINGMGYDKYVGSPVWDNFSINYTSAQKKTASIVPGYRLKIAVCRLLEFNSAQRFDIVYFDAFASARQPEMWTEGSLRRAASFLKPGGIFVTYAITGNLKRILKTLGFNIEKLEGAPGKREMLRATLM